MNDKRIKKLSHRMSWMLRHGAGELGLRMDAAGWVELNEVIHRLHATSDEVDHVVRFNNKSRYEVDGDRIRASQGHSRDGMPVTQKALEGSWDVYDGAPTIWHGTHAGALRSIAEEGLVPGRRTHVHLARKVNSRVGKRANVGVMLGASVERLRGRGIEVYVSPNDVLLARAVPVSCIVDLRAMTRATRSDEAGLRAIFGLAPRPAVDPIAAGS